MQKAPGQHTQHYTETSDHSFTHSQSSHELSRVLVPGITRVSRVTTSCLYHQTVLDVNIERIFSHHLKLNEKTKFYKITDTANRVISGTLTSCVCVYVCVCDGARTSCSRYSGRSSCTASENSVMYRLVFSQMLSTSSGSSSATSSRSTTNATCSLWARDTYNPNGEQDVAESGTRFRFLTVRTTDARVDSWDVKRISMK